MSPAALTERAIKDDGSAQRQACDQKAEKTPSEGREDEEKGILECHAERLRAESSLGLVFCGGVLRDIGICGNAAMGLETKINAADR